MKIYRPRRKSYLLTFFFNAFHKHTLPYSLLSSLLACQSPSVRILFVPMVPRFALQIWLCGYLGEKYRHGSIISCCLAFEGLPVHTLGLPTIAVENSRFPAQRFPDSIRSPQGAVVRGFALAWKGESMTGPAGEHSVTIEYRHSSSAISRRT